MLPILKEEGPKVEAIKNNPPLPPMQKMKQLRAIHNESAPQLQKILSPAQYQQLQAIREADQEGDCEKARRGLILDSARCRHPRFAVIYIQNDLPGVNPFE